MSDTVTADITDQVDGATSTFSVGVYDSGTLVVALNGVRLRPGAGNDYLESGAGFVTAEPPVVGDTLQVQYEVGGASFVVIGTGRPPGPC